MTPALEALEIQLGDVDNLISHHSSVINPRRGRPAIDEGPLLRSCVLLAYAAWEVYIENSLIWAVEQLTSRSSPDRLPDALRSYVGRTVEKEPWKLAGEDWRETAVKIVTTRVRGDEDAGAYGVNTAGPGLIVSLHREVLGARLLNDCGWTNSPPVKVKEDLQLFVKVRGSIAHTGSTEGSLYLDGVRSWRDFIKRLAGQLDRRLEDWVEDQLAEAGSV